MLKLGLEPLLCGDSAEDIQGPAITEWLYCTREGLIKQADNITHTPDYNMIITQKTFHSLQCSCCCGQASDL